MNHSPPLKTTQILLAEENTAALQSLLWHLSREAFEHKLQILLLPKETEANPDLARDLQNAYQYYAYLNGGYQADQPFICPVEVFAYNPTEKAEPLLQGQETVQILLSDPLSQKQNAGLKSLSQINASLQHNQPPQTAQPAEIWHDEKAEELLKNCVETWKQADPKALQDLWKSSAGALYRCLQDMQLWRERGLQTHSVLFEPLIPELLATPQAWHLHMLLLLFKRVYPLEAQNLAKAPVFFQTLYPFYLQANQQHLEILPPVQDWEVTLLVITYNRPDWLKRTLESILAQTYPHWRLVLIDHGSSDSTTGYCEKMAQQDARIHFQRLEQNQGMLGLQEIWQKFCQECPTELLAIVSDDDWYAPHYLETLVNYLQAHPWVAKVFGSYQNVDIHEKPLQAYGPLYPQACRVEPRIELQRALVASMFSEHHLIRKQVLKRIVAADPYVAPGSEYAAFDFILGVKLPALFEVGYVSESLSFITLHGQSTFIHDASMSYYLLVVLEEIIKDYSALFGSNSFPLSSAEHFMREQIERNLEKFKQTLFSLPDPKGLEQQIQTSQKTWAQYLRLKSEFLPLCHPQKASLFSSDPEAAYQYKSPSLRY